MDARDAGGAKIAGGYLKITNTGKSPDRLVSAISAGADRVEIHEMSMTDGVMKMRPLADGLTIKPGETVELKPGGLHMMFMDIKQPLKQGDKLKATLTFEKAGKLDVSFDVNAMGATGEPRLTSTNSQGHRDAAVTLPHQGARSSWLAK